MKGRFTHILLAALCAVTITPAFAGWEYPGEYIGQGWYEDDGARFVVSVRGGASIAWGKIENKLGAITTQYCYNENGELGYCSETGFSTFLGYGYLSSLPATEDLSSVSFAAGASVGFTLPYRPQWRMELGWDHITEADYNASPLFEGELRLNTGDVIESESVGAVESKLSTDVFSVMAFYDFFDGMQKPSHTVIPYVGLGIGYARSKTVTNLSDPYGNLSDDVDMRNFGTPSGYYNILNFYRSETETGTFALLAAFGLSYGVTEYMYFDFGARLMYVPHVKWTLQNEDDTRHRDLFAAKNIIYGNLMLGLRFEF